MSFDPMLALVGVLLYLVLASASLAGALFAFLVADVLYQSHHRRK